MDANENDEIGKRADWKCARGWVITLEREKRLITVQNNEFGKKCNKSTRNRPINSNSIVPYVDDNLCVVQLQTL